MPPRPPRWLFVGLAALTGCGGKPEPLTPVRGLILLDGRPLSAGAIAFTPDPERGTGGAVAHGRVGPDGTYTLFTDSSPGAAPGWYRVSVASVMEGPPARYRHPNLSGLHHEVRPGRENVIDIHLSGERR